MDERNKNKQVLDRLEVERKRGITVKAQTASMFYQLDGQDYLLNLIDTPVAANFSLPAAADDQANCNLMTNK